MKTVEKNEIQMEILRNNFLGQKCSSFPIEIIRLIRDFDPIYRQLFSSQIVTKIGKHAWDFWLKHWQKTITLKYQLFSDEIQLLDKYNQHLEQCKTMVWYIIPSPIRKKKIYIFNNTKDPKTDPKK